MSADSPAADLLHLLAREREALCAARLEEVAPLGLRKQVAIARLAAADPDPAALVPLRAAARRNARLLAAALTGLREGMARRDAARTAAAGFSAYDESGRPDRITSPDPRRLEHRA